MSENLRKYINWKNNQIINAIQKGNDFKSIFELMHDQDNRIFCEYIENFKIKKISYVEFKKYVYQTANYLKKNITITKGAYIGLLMENCVNWVSIFWALLMIGYKPLLLNAKLPISLNKDVLQMVHCAFVITDDSFDHYDLEIEKLVLKKTIGLSDNLLNEELLKEETWDDEIALTTTATSLNVKCCVYTGENFLSQLSNTKYILNHNKMVKKHYKGSLKQLCFLPFYHIFGLIATYFWFASFGRTFVFLNDLSSNTILKTIRKHEVTHVFAVPLLWHTIYKEIMKQVNAMDEKTIKKFNKGIRLSLALQNFNPVIGQKIACKLFSEIQGKVFGSQIKFLISGGGYISNDALKLMNAIGYPLYNGYGASEIGITSVELRNKPSKRMKATVGKPFPSIQYQIEDGVLKVKGKSIASKIITKDKMIETNYNEWFNTTDLVSIDKDNYYSIIGRKDDVYIGQSGEKINPDSIEKELKFTSINHYCVLGLTIKDKKELALIIELDRDMNDIKVSHVLSEVKENVDRLKMQNYQLDQIYYSTDAICNPNAIKVSRNALNKFIELNQVHLKKIQELNSDKLKDLDLLSRELCDEVRALMANILDKNVDDIKDNAHFIFDLGGTSLDYCTLLMELKKKYDMDFDLKDHSFTNAIEFSNYIIKKLK